MMAAFEGVTDLRYDTSDQDRALMVSLASVDYLAHRIADMVSAIRTSLRRVAHGSASKQGIPCCFQ